MVVEPSPLRRGRGTRDVREEALLLSHEGTPERFAEAVRRVSPSTVVQVLAPGQPLVIAAAAVP
jgi:hypothetical protein